MKAKIGYIIALMASALLVVGCQGGFAPQDEAQCDVSLNVTTVEATNVLKVSTRVGETPTFRLSIFKGTELVESHEDYTRIEKLSLAAGSYKFVVESGEDLPAAIEAPYYRGEKTVMVKVGQSNVVDMSAALANVRVSVVVSDLIKGSFTDYSLTINEVVLTKSDILADRSMYVSAKDQKFGWLLTMVNTQGTIGMFPKEMTDVKPCSHYRFNFDIDQTAQEDEGQLTLDLTVDTSVEHIQEDIDISLEQYELPRMTPRSASTKFDEQVIINEVNRGADLHIDLNATGGIKQLKIRHTSAWLDAQGIPRVFFPSALDMVTAEAIKRAGIDWSTPLIDQKTGYIDFTGVGTRAPLGEHNIYITIEDKQGQVVNHTLSLMVLPDQDHLTRTPEVGAKYAIFNGEWCTLVMPEGIAFQYKEQGASDWIEVPVIQSTLDDGDKLFSAKIKGLKVTTTYQYRTYSPAAGEKQGQIVEFTTNDAPEIPNLDFEQGYWSGSNWYSNASGGNSYWASGNEGVTGWPVSLNSNAYPEEKDVVRGKAIRMTSVPINVSVSPVKFAAGNMFTGSYSTDINNPINSVKFGRPYKGRPLALTGYYKYWPKVIDNNAYQGGVSGASGQMDKAHIYISLEDWGSSSSRPSSPRVIGYGEIRSDEQITEAYRHFYIPIVYSDPTRKPTHVVLAITSSHHGGNFCGANGSEMLVDEFALEWELSEQEWKAQN